MNLIHRGTRESEDGVDVEVSFRPPDEIGEWVVTTHIYRKNTPDYLNFTIEEEQKRGESKDYSQRSIRTHKPLPMERTFNGKDSKWVKG